MNVVEPDDYDDEDYDLDDDGDDGGDDVACLESDWLHIKRIGARCLVPL